MANQHTTPVKSLEAAYAAEQRARAGHESRMKKDPCYPVYAAALKCLDDNNYTHDLCAGAFQDFKDCRKAQEEANTRSRFRAQEADPLLGWAFKMYNDWAAQRAAAPPGEAGPAAAAAAAGAGAGSAADSSSSSGGGGGGSSRDSGGGDGGGSEQQGWRPPAEEDARREWKFQAPPPPRRVP